MRVELDIFSGRPNPVWDLPEDKIGEFQSMMSRSSPSREKIDPPGLGYRGFIVYLPRPVRVYKGQILDERSGSQAKLTEVGITLESWLLELGRTHLDPAVYDACLAALQRS